MHVLLQFIGAMTRRNSQSCLQRDVRLVRSRGLRTFDAPVCRSARCTWTMMFRAWDEPDHDASMASISCAECRNNFIDTADVYPRASRRSLPASVENRLRRLGTPMDGSLPGAPAGSGHVVKRRTS